LSGEGDEAYGCNYQFEYETVRFLAGKKQELDIMK
jgi:hypothetical protein